MNNIENGIENVSSGSYSPRIIPLNQLTAGVDVNSYTTLSGYEAGLSKDDFIGSWMISWDGYTKSSIGIISDFRFSGSSDDKIALKLTDNEDNPPIYVYDPETGIFTLVPEGD